MRPRLKYPLSRDQEPGEVRIHLREERSEVRLDDPDGKVGALVKRLDGRQDVDALVARVCTEFPEVASGEVVAAIDALDEAGLLEDAGAETTLTAEQLERYRSNLEFFRRYARLRQPHFRHQEKLCSSSVVLLGAGGLGSIVLLNLAGMGVGRIDVVDHDRIELPNLARQFLYREGDIGSGKADVACAVATALNSEVRAVPHAVQIHGLDDLSSLIEGADLVIAGIDATEQMLQWTNAACVRSGVPFLYGGWWSWGGTLYSVVPRATGCLVCGGLQVVEAASPATGFPNPGIGPASTLIGALVSLEALRYLTRFAPPISGGKLWDVNFASGQLCLREEWARESDCPVCGDRGLGDTPTPVH